MWECLGGCGWVYINHHNSSLCARIHIRSFLAGTMSANLIALAMHGDDSDSGEAMSHNAEYGVRDGDGDAMTQGECQPKRGMDKKKKESLLRRDAIL